MGKRNKVLKEYTNKLVPSNRVTSSGFCIKLEISQKSLPIFNTFFPLKRCIYSGPRCGLVFLGQNHHLGPEFFLFFKVTKLPYHLVAPSPFQLYRRVTELPDFWDSQNLTLSEKPCVRPLKKLPYKVFIFLYFMNQKNILRGPCFL